MSRVILAKNNWQFVENFCDKEFPRNCFLRIKIKNKQNERVVYKIICLQESTLCFNTHR